MRKVTGLLLCVVCLLVFSAYDWGRKSPTQTPTRGTKQTAAVAEAASPVAAPVAYRENVQKTYEEVEEAVSAMPKPVVQARTPKKVTATPVVAKTTPAQPAVTAPATTANDKAVAIVTLAKIVGSGTPEERKARIESLKRLSEALAKSQAQQP